ncbi:MAG: hypothetical protein ABSH51_05780 [Solirubrobacteraceae bacterium]
MTFRDDLLVGRRVAIAGGGGVAILEQLRSLGAWVDHLAGDVLSDEDAAAAWARERAPLTAAVIGAGEPFAAGGPAGLSDALELSWRAAHALATGALIEAQEPARIVFVAPWRDAGPHAEAARAGLENLARTLSVEWARFAITAVAIAPGPATTAAQIAELVCYLVSPAGGYLSGCRFDLGLIGAAAG